MTDENPFLSREDLIAFVEHVVMRLEDDPELKNSIPAELIDQLKQLLPEIIEAYGNKRHTQSDLLLANLALRLNRPAGVPNLSGYFGAEPGGH
jgi:hypothetical protein